MPLTTVQVGRRVKLVSVEAGQGLKGRLAAMGLVSGVEIEVLRDSPPGPFLIAGKRSRIMLGRGMANKIMVA